MRTLQSKFAFLLGVFASIVALSLGVAMLYGNHLEKELRWPLEETSVVLRDLALLKRSTGQLTRQLPGPVRDVPGLNYEGPIAQGENIEPRLLIDAEAAFLEDQRVVHLHRDDLFAHEFLDERVGVSTARNLDARVNDAARLAGAWFESGDLDTGVRAGDAHYQIHELIEQIEAKVIRDVTDYATSYNEELGRSYRVVLASGIFVAALVGVLGVLLVKRWVIAPVEDLRDATKKIARGDFTHRLTPRSQDELGALAQEVNHMTGTIDTMQREAVERERLAAMGEMVRRLAHNIRNPLAGIRSIAELSKRRAIDDEALRTDQESIISTVDRFNSWLSELLDATSPLSISCAPTDIRTWLRGLITSQHTIATMKDIEIVVEDDTAPATAEFDARHLEHAVVGILTNALQASPNHTTVTIRAAAENGSQWRIEVQDEGPGIPDEIREKIFTPYFTTKSDGNGIGLAVTNHIVNQHKGTIRVISAPDSGTRFVIVLPMTQD